MSYSRLYAKVRLASAASSEAANAGVNTHPNGLLSMKHCLWPYVCAFTVYALSVPPAKGEVHIEGKKELIALVVSSQQTNASMSKSGTLSADVEIRNGTDLTNSDVEVTWNETGTYWRYDTTTTSGSVKRRLSGEIIHRGKQWIYYSPEAKLAQRTPEGVFELREELKILPKDLWYKVDGRTPIIEFVNPATHSELLTKFVIKEDHDSQCVVLERHYKIGGYYGFRISLAHGGNLVAYDTTQKKGQGVWIRGTFDWVKDQRGTWYARHVKLERSMAGTPATIDHTIAVTIKKYSSEPDIPADRFTIESLELPEGTRIEIFGPDKKVIAQSRRRVGPKVTEQDLNQLIRTLQQGRLAKPDR